ncbi:serine O-acetyltransferase [Silicimonas sp. MF1-12-2]|jgi:serine O-acetyltransferase|uniref:serine O-acetyltransferase n=1 Tax=Silicimonas sp. MF1-12-2 TaxID=3384793 RepID=UPI0039B59D0C
MAEHQRKPRPLDPVWDRIQEDAKAAIASEPLMGGMIHTTVLHHNSLESALSYRIAMKLASDEMPSQIVRELADAAYTADPSLGDAARADLVAVYERDPACHSLLQPLLFFKGFQAIQAYRIGHWLWRNDRKDLAYFFQARVSEVFGIDIHPNARIGKGLMIDHAHSIVIGETAVVGDNVSMLHSVTLGGTGKEDDDRHPKIGDGVLIGAGAKVLGNIRIGNCSRIAAGSVVLQEVPPCKTVAGVPARIVGEAGCDQPALTMDQILNSSPGD